MGNRGKYTKIKEKQEETWRNREKKPQNFLDSLYIKFFSTVNFCIKYQIHILVKVKIAKVSDPQLIKKLHLKGIIYNIY